MRRGEIPSRLLLPLVREKSAGWQREEGSLSNLFLMACAVTDLKSQAACIAPCMSRIELLASIACSLATLNGMSCSAAALKSQAACIWPCMSEEELLAAIAVNVCEFAGGGGGGGGHNVIYWEDTGPNPSGPPPDVSIAWEVRFRDGNPPVVWDPALPGWV